MGDRGPLGAWRVPADLTAVGLAVVLTVVTVFTPGLRATPLRIVTALPFVLFVPGYSLVAALFPRAGERADVAGNETNDTSVGRRRDGRISGLERVVFAVGTSIGLLFGVVVVLTLSPWSISPVSTVVSVSVISLLAAAVGTARRWRVPDEERFRLRYRQWLPTSRSGMFQYEARTDAVLDVVVVLALLLAVGSVGYALTGAGQGGSTELYLLTENGTESPVAADTTYTLNESQPLVIGVTNHERERTQYSVVVIVEEVAVQNDELRILERKRVRTFRTTLADNETWQRRHKITPSLTGDNLRLRYLLYRGAPPSNPTVGNAIQEVHLWIDDGSG